MNHEIEIHPLHFDSGVGWKLRLLENGEQVGEIGFPIADDEYDIETALHATYCKAQEEARIWLESKYRYRVRRNRAYVVPTVLALTGVVVAFFAFLLIFEFPSL